MPRIAEFYGVAIYMYFRDHSPPHFHAIYGRFEAEVEIATGDILKGSLPPAAERRVREWCAVHQLELADNWRRARAHEPLKSISLQD